MIKIEACKVEDIAEGETFKVDFGQGIAVFNVNGTLYATDDTCTHGKSSLSDGWLEGDVIECAWHAGKFCVRTGKPLSLPVTKPIRTYPIQIEGGSVFIEIEDN